MTRYQFITQLIMSIAISYHFIVAEYEAAIGYLDVKTAAGGVSFYVQRNTTYLSTGTVIPYQVERLNNGGAMNLTTGVYSLPPSTVDIILALMHLR
jgi:hypothetical protein